MSVQPQALKFDFTSSLRKTLERFEQLSDGKREDYDRAKKVADKLETEEPLIGEKEEIS
ncbi:MAG: hypothetical protein ACU0CB_07230 [Roseovarius sp.]|uniref:hypothetical protein n=1 Tax=Roseovarius sp. TaxID=1486281 RepID=UPI00260DADE0|nr:hypothetical protein [Roseovarius sp.]